MAQRVSRCAIAVPHATFESDTSPGICESYQSHFPCGLVVGKSLMLVAIVIENAFRPYNGRTVVDFWFAVCCRSARIKEVT